MKYMAFNKEYGGIKTGIGLSKKPIDFKKKDVLRGIVKRKMPDFKPLPRTPTPPFGNRNIPRGFTSGTQELQIRRKITPKEREDWMKNFDEKGFVKPGAFRSKENDDIMKAAFEKLNKKKPPVSSGSAPDGILF